MADAFSYDDIYDLLRTEKFASELQSISSETLEKIRKYLEGKQKLLNKEEESTQIFGAQKRATIQLEIDNAKRALKDFYEFREKKIINRAVFSVRSGSVIRDTTNMLAHEEEFYNQLIQIIPLNRKEFFNQLEPVGSNNISSESTKEGKTPENISSELTKESKPEDGSENITPNEEQKTEIVKVAFTEDVESFVAEDLKSYGPYSKDSEAGIPGAIANLLIAQNKARIIKNGGETQKENEISETGEELLHELQETHSATGQAGKDQSQTED